MAAGSTDRLMDTSDLAATIDAYHERGARRPTLDDAKLSHYLSLKSMVQYGWAV